MSSLVCSALHMCVIIMVLVFWGCALWIDLFSQLAFIMYDCFFSGLF